MFLNFPFFNIEYFTVKKGQELREVWTSKDCDVGNVHQINLRSGEIESSASAISITGTNESLESANPGM